ncbi:MAG: protein phosphatase 2C domain-containing protein [Ruminococcus sp.]|nr:protein phosphatase 2C domain-containing protein [Ruminococcus sp.]
MFKGFSNSVRGASHEKRNLVCQDSSAYKTCDRYAIAVVADGHGSKKHFRSHLGSKAAVEATIETIEKFYADPDRFEECFQANPKLVIQNIEKQVISLWNDKVFAHISENPVTREEKSDFTNDEFSKIPVESYYGSTLIAAVMGRKFSFGFQLGDGSLVAVFEDGETVMPIGDDESAPANITASICNSNASRMFNSFYEPNRKILALLCSTDGLYTSFGSDNDFLDYHTIIAGQLHNAKDFEPSIVKNITKRTHFGTEDDISLSCVFDEQLAFDKLEDLQKTIAKNKEKAAARKAKLLNR